MKKKKKKGVKKKVSGKKKVARKVKKKKATRVAKKRVAKRKKKVAPKAKERPTPISSIPAGVSLEEVGEVTHYFPHVEAAVIKLTKGVLSVGDKVIVKGHTTDFQEKIDSMQLDHVPITSATIGQEIGLKVKSKVREHDVVYKLVS